MQPQRREFLLQAGAVSAGLLTCASAQASGHEHHLSPNTMGVLVDLTECIGCRLCEYACKKANDQETGALKSYDDQSVFRIYRRPSPKGYTVINAFKDEDEKPVYAKVNCVHCNYAACVSACIVGALTKEENGAVIYDAWKCIGCRYCMVACPYQIPAYEYDNALTPKVMKCTLCPERTLKENRPPACVEICPREAIVYGKREQLLELAHERIAQHPDRYHPEVYGEHAVGGTSWLLLADRPVTELGIPKLSDQSPAVLTESIQHGIFRGFTGPLMIFGLVSVLMKSSTDKRHGNWTQDEKDGEDHHG